MNAITTRTRIAFGLVCLLLSVLLVAMVLGIVPDRYRAVLDGRKALCEAIAVNGSILVTQRDVDRLQAVLRATAQRNTDILSAAVRRTDGKLLVEVGDHKTHWTLAPGDHSTETQVQVPIRAGEQKWGTIEICFRPAEASGILGSWFGARARMVTFVAGCCFLAFLYYLKKMLEYLDPSQTVPGHVRSALDTLAEGLLVLDGRDRIVLVNQSFALLLNTPPEKLLGHVASRLPWVAEEGDGPVTSFPWSVAMREKRLQRDAVLRLRTAAGEVRTFMVNCSPVLGHNGQYRGVLASFDDVTRLEQKEIELRKSKQIAEDANRTKSQFLANMSHEIRTPMNAILGFTDLLRRGMIGCDEERAEHLDTIYRSGEHLLSLINDILDLSKIESGRLEVERISMRPHTIIQEVVTALGMQARQRGLTLDFLPQGRLPETIQSDPLRVRQIVTNLVGNALKFTKQGGVTIRAQLVDGRRQTADGEIPSASPSTVCRLPSTMLKIEVVDTGVGIPEESLEKIFQPFTQADSSVTRQFGGTGLGLTISRRFAEALGGSLVASSRPSAGSTFTLAIPTGPLEAVRMFSGDELATETSRDPAQEQVLRRPRPGKILLVDDGEANRQLIRLVLVRAGLTVIEAENGKEALERAEENVFDLVLMDMQMPVMDGYTAASRLRERGFASPIVALTGNAMKGDKEKCLEAGCSGFLSKPVSLDKLMELLVRELGEAREEVRGQESEVRPPTSDLRPLTSDLRPPTTAGRPPLVSALWSDDAEFQEIVVGFTTKLRAQIPLLERALQEQNWRELAQMAHWLKGSAGTLGFDPIVEPAMQLEQCAKSAQSDEAEKALCEVVELVASIALPGYPAETTVAGSTEQGAGSKTSDCPLTPRSLLPAPCPS